MKLAELSDIPRCIDLGRQFYAEAEFEKTIGAFDESYNKEYLTSLIESPNAALFLHDHGMAAVLLSKSLIAPVLIAQELFWYVEKDHRGGTAAARLFGSIQEWAKNHGAEAMYMICMHNMGDTAQRMYERCGYVPREHVFVKAL